MQSYLSRSGSTANNPIASSERTSRTIRFNSSHFCNTFLLYRICPSQIWSSANLPTQSHHSNLPPSGTASDGVAASSVFSTSCARGSSRTAAFCSVPILEIQILGWSNSEIPVFDFKFQFRWNFGILEEHGGGFKFQLSQKPFRQMFIKIEHKMAMFAEKKDVRTF